MKTALITGNNGFVGQHLYKYLLGQDYKVFGLGRKNCDIRNYERVRNILDEIRPDEIYHLAAQAYVPESTTNPQRTFAVNTIGSVNVLEAVRQLGIKTKILLAGTSEEYGDAKPASEFVTEETLPSPQSPYAISKLAMDYVGRWYAKVYGMNVVVARAFNHTGAGRGEMYAESAWAKQIVEIERGRREYLEHGNLESVRNYNDVRDIVGAYTLAIMLPSDIYNICSDNNLTMSEVLDMLVDNAKCEIKTKQNPALCRQYDFSFSPPSAEKFRKLTTWQPRISPEQTFAYLLEYWREKL